MLGITIMAKTMPSRYVYCICRLEERNTLSHSTHHQIGKGDGSTERKHTYDVKKETVISRKEEAKYRYFFTTNNIKSLQ